MLADFGATHQTRVESLPSSVNGILDLWIAGREEEDAPRPETVPGELPALVTRARELTKTLLALSERYELVLATRPDLLNEIHIATEMSAQAVGGFELVDRGSSLDPVQVERKGLALSVAAAKAVASVLSEYCDAWVMQIPIDQCQSWYDLHRGEQ